MVFENTDYSWVSVKVYTAAGTLGDTIPDGWQDNFLSGGRLDFPHFQNWETISTTQEYISNTSTAAKLINGPQISLYGIDSGGVPPGVSAAGTVAINAAIQRNYRQLNAASPAFFYQSRITTTRGYTNRSGFSIFPYFYGVRGPTANNLVIVTSEGFNNVYVFHVLTPGSGAFPVAIEGEIQGNGSIVCDSTKTLCVPTLNFVVQQSTYAAAQGYGLLLTAMTDDSTVQGLSGIRILATSINNVVRATFQALPDTYQRTIDFLNRWPLNGKSFFDHNSFIKGYLVGQRLREWAAGEYVSDDPQGGSGGGTGKYDQKSFLSGLCAGRVSHGWPMGR